jgi:hypothetical protein
MLLASSPVRTNGDDALRIKTVEILLGGASFVPMMQTADFGNCNNLPDRPYRTPDPPGQIAGMSENETVLSRFGSQIR